MVLQEQILPRTNEMGRVVDVFDNAAIVEGGVEVGHQRCDVLGLGDERVHERAHVEKSARRNYHLIEHMTVVGEFKFELNYRGFEVVFAQVVVAFDLILSKLRRVDVDPVDYLIELGSHHRLMVVVFVVFDHCLFAVVLKCVTRHCVRHCRQLGQTCHF